MTAWTDDGEIMGVRHTGLRFRRRAWKGCSSTRSILTEHGHAVPEELSGLEETGLL